MGLNVAEVRVDLARLSRNIETVKQKIGYRVKLLLTMKADAYGHGSLPVARRAEEAGVDWLGVANMREAKELCDAGIRLPILILGLSLMEHVEDLVMFDVSVTIDNLEFARALDRESRRQGSKTKVQVKVDTGLGRVGITPDQAIPFFKELGRLSHLEVEGVFSHFSASYSKEAADQEYTRNQIAKFNHVLEQLDAARMLPPLRHIANSAGLIQYNDQVTAGYFNMVRPGLLLYGYHDVEADWVKEIKSVLSLHTWVVSVKEVRPGSYLGYDRTYQVKYPMQIAILPVGYEEGVSWYLSNVGEVVIRGRRAPIVGRVSMDQTIVDVTHIDGVAIGDEVELISDRIPADELAQKIGSGVTEVILTGISPRVERAYTNFTPPAFRTSP